MESCGRTDQGRVRENNEDSILLNQKLQLFMVADGMGGHAYGEVASAMAVQVVEGYLRTQLAATAPMKHEGSEDIANLLEEAVHSAHLSIYDYSQKLPGRETMGTTLSLLLFRKNTVFLAHVGDSRIYRLRSDYLEKLTKDHNVAQELVDKGLISEEEADSHPLSNVITRALGIRDDWEPDTAILDVEPGDRFLLSSDGLFRDVKISFVQSVIAGDQPVKEKCRILVEQALVNGARDNVSVIVVES